MRYIFRDNVIFIYDPLTKQVSEEKRESPICSFNICKFIPEDYKLLSEFFEKAHKHSTGQKIELTDINVY